MIGDLLGPVLGFVFEHGALLAGGGGAAGIATAFLPGGKAKLIAIGLAALALVVGTAWVTAQVKQAEIETMKAGYAQAEADAVRVALERQKAQNEVDKNTAVDEATKQAAIAARANTIKEKVTVYVPVTTKCPVTVGFIRVLDAAVLGVSPGDIPIAAGQSDDSCAATDPRTLALNIVANYGACHANAQQLTSLQGWVKATNEASKRAAGKR